MGEHSCSDGLLVAWCFYAPHCDFSLSIFCNYPGRLNINCKLEPRQLDMFCSRKRILELQRALMPIPCLGLV